MAGKTENLVCANKKGSASRAGVDRGEPKGRKGRRTYRRKKWHGPFFGRIYRSRIVYVWLCVYAHACEFEQLNHRNFISVRRPGNITVRSVVVARDFGSGPAVLLAQNFFHSSAANHPQESEEAASLIGQEESSVDINSAVKEKKRTIQELIS